MRLFILIILTLPLEASFSPWGKDEGITYFEEQTQKSSTTHTGHLAEPLIRFHQEIISPADGPRSHFFPSSSQYTLDAVKTYGLIKGVLMGCDRLTRENGEKWVYETIKMEDERVLKWDPIPSI